MPPPSTNNKDVVWDLPTRVFHWALVVLMVLAWATAEAKGSWFWLHVVFGQAALALVIFRLIWGVIGGRYARFVDFVKGPGAVKAHLGSLLGRNPLHHAGHNPAAGWMILVLLAVSFALSFSGLFLIEPPYMGPYARFGDLDDDLHEGLAEVLWVLVILHVLAALLMSVLMGENLIRAMWTGKKDLLPQANGASRVPVTVAPWRAVVAAAMAIFLALWPFL